MALRKRMVQLGCNSAFYSTKFRFINSSASASTCVSNRFDYRHISQLVNPNGKRAFLVDTLALVIPNTFAFCFLNGFFLFIYLMLGSSNYTIVLL